MRRVINPRYHSNYGNNFRHFPSSVKPFAFTQQYGRSLHGKHFSVLRLRSDRSFGRSCYCLAPPDNSLETQRSDPLRHSLFVIFKFCPIIAPFFYFVNTFLKISIYSTKISHSFSFPLRARTNRYRKIRISRSFPCRRQGLPLFRYHRI